MNKSDMIDVIVDKADISKASAARALDAALDAIQVALGKGETVALVGFGTFVVRSRPARTGRNPRTGEDVHIAARNVPAFRPGKALKDAVNS